MITKPRTLKKRGRRHVGSLIRTLAWEWVKFNHPKISHRIKAIAYEECGLTPPKPESTNQHLLELLKKV